MGWGGGWGGGGGGDVGGMCRYVVIFWGCVVVGFGGVVVW